MSIPASTKAHTPALDGHRRQVLTIQEVWPPDLRDMQPYSISFHTQSIQLANLPFIIPEQVKQCPTPDATFLGFIADVHLCRNPYLNWGDKPYASLLAGVYSDPPEDIHPAGY